MYARSNCVPLSEMSLLLWPNNTDQGHNIHEYYPALFSKHTAISSNKFSLSFILLLLVGHYIISYVSLHI